MLAVDHVIVVVDDLDDAARRYDEELGLASVAGGRHGGHGTGNRIVPLGGSYIELMAVVDRDEAATSPLARGCCDGSPRPAKSRRRCACGPTTSTPTARRTGHQPLAMSRTRPDGVQLDWHLVAHDAAFDEGLPFFIQWHVADVDHPGRMPVEHGVAAAGIDWVEIGGDPDRLASWLGAARPAASARRRCAGSAPGRRDDRRGRTGRHRLNRHVTTPAPRSSLWHGH